MSTILVLDVHATNREVLVSLLGYKGHRMLPAEDRLFWFEVVTLPHV